MASAFDQVAPRERLTYKPLFYALTPLDQVQFQSLIEDEELYDLTETHIGGRSDIGSKIRRFFNDAAFIERTTGILLPAPLRDYEYLPKLEKKDEAAVANYSSYIRALATLAKMIAFDALFHTLRNGGATLDPTPDQAHYLDRYYSRIRGCVEVSIRKTMLYLMEVHSSFAKDGGTGVEINDRSEAMCFIKLLIKMTVRAFLQAMTQTHHSWKTSAKPEFQQTIAGIIDLEFALVVNDPTFQDADEEQVEQAIVARVREIYTMLGVPDIDYINRFMTQLIKLSLGAKIATFGIHKSTVRGIGAAQPGMKVRGSKLSQMTRKEHLHGGTDIGRSFLQKKAQTRSLSQRHRETEEHTNGGEVIVLCDCTGSTLPSQDGYGLANILEAVNIALIDAARQSDRKCSIYFYNEGTIGVETFNPTEPETAIRAKKLKVLQRAQSRENGELQTFAEVFAEVNRKPGRKFSIVFMSDGGMLTTCQDQFAEAQRLRATMALYPQIEVLPVLFSYCIDPVFEVVFEGYQYLHIQNEDAFGATDLMKLVDFVKTTEAAGNDE